MSNACESIRALEDQSSEGELGLTTEVKGRCATTLGGNNKVSSAMEGDDQKPKAGVMQAPEMLAFEQGLQEGVMTGS
jgi:hypothetical protein